MDSSFPNIVIVAPSNRMIGGQALHAATLVDQFQRQGYGARLVPIDPAFPRRMARLRRIPYLRTLINQCLYLPSLLQLRRTDIVHVSSASYWSFLLAPLPAMVMGRLFGKPVILNYHSGEAADHLAHWGVLIHPWLRLADEIVVPSEYLRQVFGAYGYRVRVIHNTVDVERYMYRVRDPLRPHFLSVRNFEWYYGVDQTLRAFALVKGVYPKATLEIAGVGSLEAELRRLAGSLGVGDGVRFVGAVSAADMPALFNRADIFLNSSIVDNQPLSVLEAMASGLPLVTTGVGDISNMVRNGVTGTIVPLRDPVAMAEAVDVLLKDSDKACRMARRAHESLDRYSWARIGGEWAALYAEIHQRAEKSYVKARRYAA